MPEVNGITLLRKLKQNIKTNHIPVILLTAKNSEKDYIEGLSLGADAYIAKPFNLDILITTIENLIKTEKYYAITLAENKNKTTILKWHNLSLQMKS